MSRILALGVLLASATPTGALDVTSCGQTVPAREVGVLRADLDCPPDVVGVHLERGAQLRLDGHRITGGLQGITARGPGRSRVTGPGEVSGAAHGCIVGYVNPEDDGKAVSLSVRDVTIAGCPESGVRGTRLDLRNVVATDTGVVDPIANTWSGMAIYGGTVRIRDSRVERNALGVGARGTVRMNNVLVRDNRAGVSTQWGTVVASASEVSGNWATGISAGGFFKPATIRLRDSRVVGNALGGDYRDLVSALRPLVSDSDCGTSGRLQRNDESGAVYIAGTWGVCTDD